MNWETTGELSTGTRRRINISTRTCMYVLLLVCVGCASLRKSCVCAATSVEVPTSSVTAPAVMPTAGATPGCPRAQAPMSAAPMSAAPMRRARAYVAEARVVGV